MEGSPRDLLVVAVATEGEGPPAGVAGGVAAAPAEQPLAAGDGDFDRYAVAAEVGDLGVLPCPRHEEHDRPGHEPDEDDDRRQLQQAPSVHLRDPGPPEVRDPVVGCPCFGVHQAGLHVRA